MEQTVLDFGRDGIVLPHGPLEDDDWAENRLASRLVEHCRYFDAVSFLVDPIVYGKQGSHATSSRRDASDASVRSGYTSVQAFLTAVPVLTWCLTLCSDTC